MKRVLVASVFATLALALGCVELTYKGESVRITSNPDVVRPCRFLGNVKATSGWGGAAGTGLASSNTEKTLQNKTADLGGNVVFVNQSGIHANGEAYACGTGGAVPPALSVSPDFIRLTNNAHEIEGCREVGPSHVRMTINSDGKVSIDSSRAARELTSQNGGDTILIAPLNNSIAEGTGYRCGQAKP